MAVSKDFLRLPGRRFQNIKTGEIISRRQFDKQTKGIQSYEQKARLNKAVEGAREVLAKPARGRSSAQKLAPEIREAVLEAREEAIKADKQIAKARRDEAKRITKIEKLKAAPIKTPRVTKQLLRTGRLGKRIGFTTYEQFRQALKEAQDIGVVSFYGLGWVGVTDRPGDQGDGLKRAITVFRMRPVKEVIEKDEFDAEMQASIREHSYIQFLNYFMHLAYSSKYAQQRIANKPKSKYNPANPRPEKKQTKRKAKR